MKKLFLMSLCFMLCSLGMVTAQKTITGTVSDSQGIPIIGANVIEIGTSNGTATDVDGTYSLQVAGEDAILRITYLGTKDIDLTVLGRNVIDVVMEDDTKLLDEVVVTALGTVQKKDEMGATVSVIETAAAIRSGEPNCLIHWQERHQISKFLPPMVILVLEQILE